MDKFLQEQIINLSEDPLQWWREHKHIYPRLYEIVKEVLCITATSVPCERIFSKAGLIIRDRHSRLLPSKAAKVIFLNHNL